MIPNCERHRWDRAEDECRSCGSAYCGSCLVYVNGAAARPLCIHCALKKSGIRGSRRSRPTWRERRARAKAERVAAARAQPAPDDERDEKVAAAAHVELPEPQAGWVSLDASRWDVGTI